MKLKSIFTTIVLTAVCFQAYGQIHLQFIKESKTKNFYGIVQAVAAPAHAAVTPASLSLSPYIP